MKNNSAFEHDEDFVDDFGEIANEEEIKPIRKEKITTIHRDKWTLVDALDVINSHMHNCQLSNDFFIRCAEAFNYLSEVLGMNTIQCVMLAMFIDSGETMTLRDMSKMLCITHLSMMRYYDDIEVLVSKHWLGHVPTRRSQKNAEYREYYLAQGVVKAICNNVAFVPASLKCDNIYMFVDRLTNYVEQLRDNDYITDEDLYWFRELAESNKDLPICKVALDLNNLSHLSLLFLVVENYANRYGSTQYGFDKHAANVFLPDNVCYYELLALENGTHKLLNDNLIEHKFEDGLVNTCKYVPTEYLKKELLSDFKPRQNRGDRTTSVDMEGHLFCKDIKPKMLFYNKEENEQVERLKNILMQDQFTQVQQRLSQKGMRTGLCVLLYGEPGTGKTATVYELARQSGRDVIQMHVTDYLNKYVGESESGLKDIFSKYKAMCENYDVKPILFLNEGDGILSKRITNIEKEVDQMSNSLQNIILEEMENLEGIMIVTTNLTTNLDSAFERRFIFKIKFDKPCMSVKAKIWKSMIDTLSDDDAMQLAEMYNLSGGEIENIARKTTMEFILTGKEADIELIKKFAHEEKIKSFNNTPIGFNTNK